MLAVVGGGGSGGDDDDDVDDDDDDDSWWRDLRLECAIVSPSLESSSAMASRLRRRSFFAFFPAWVLSFSG